MEERQTRGPVRWPADDQIAAAAEEVWQVVVTLPVNGDTEGLKPLASRLLDGLSGVLDAPAALVSVEVARFAVG